jgi:hypothetical protein
MRFVTSNCAFNVSNLSMMCLVKINIIDGEEWAYKVRFNMKDGDGDVFFRPTEVTPLIGV